MDWGYHYNTPPTVQLSHANPLPPTAPMYTSPPPYDSAAKPPPPGFAMTYPEQRCWPTAQPQPASHNVQNVNVVNTIGAGPYQPFTLPAQALQAMHYAGLQPAQMFQPQPQPAYGNPCRPPVGPAMAHSGQQPWSNARPPSTQNVTVFNVIGQKLFGPKFK